MAKVVASYLYSGLSDYWGGDGRRWDDDAGCVFALYNGRTGMRDLIDSAVEDFCNGGDFFPSGDGPDLWEDVTEDDVRAALLDCLTDSGREDYEANALWEGAAEYAAVNDLDVCRDCGARIGEPHEDDCPILEELSDDDDHNVTEDDCENDDCWDSPVCIFLLELVEDDE